MESNTRRLIYYFLLPISVVVFLLALAVQSYNPEYLMQLDFLDVGQGDAIYIKTAQGNQVLIDGGPDSSVLGQLGKVMPFFDRSIDLIILTHPDADHVSGLVEVLKRFKVAKVLVTGVRTESAVYQEFIRLLEEKKVEIVEVRQGQRVHLDESTVFDIYWPGALVTESNLATNDTSIYGKLIFGNTKVLLTGDAASRVEDALLPIFNLDADLLKVGHHGSKTSTSLQFIQEVTPNYSVIQVAKENSYGHPSKEVLDMLESQGGDVIRTDIHGRVRFLSNGFTIQRVLGKMQRLR